MVSNPKFSIEDRQDNPLEFAKPQNPEGELHLRFYITSGYELALPAISIREVVSPSPDRITPIPNTSPLLLGTLNFRGQAVWVADLDQFLGGLEPLDTDRSEISVIVVEDQEVIVGLAVERIVGMDWLRADKAQASKNSLDNMAPFLKGEWPVDGEANRWLHLLDPITVLRSARWAA